MKKILSFLFSLLLLSIIPSCVNDGDIGDLYGKWQLLRHTTGDTETAYRQSFMSFQNSVVQMQVVDADAHSYFSIWGNFVHRGDSLLCSFVSRDFVTGEADAELLLPTLMEKYFGMQVNTDNKIGFRILRLDSKHLTLEQNNETWTFRYF